MRRIILFLQLLLGVEMIYAQTETEILNYSRLSYAGSARAAAMGGAFGALGGDISSWNLNPAAVGVFRKSSVTYTSVLNFSGNESGELTARKTSYLIGTVGGVLSGYVKDEKSDWKGFNLGFSYTDLSNNIQNTRQQVYHSPTSLTDVYVWQSQGYKPDELNIFTTGPFYDTYLLYQDENESYHSILETDGETAEWVDQYQEIREKGYLGEFSIAGGTNYKDKLYLGAVLGIQWTYDKQRILYSEIAEENAPSLLDFYEFRQYRHTRGTGINLKLGLIYRPVPAIRLGAAIHLPTWFTMEYTLENSVHTYFTTPTDPSVGRDKQEYEISNRAYGTYYDPYRYLANVRTPWRAFLCWGLVLGQHVMLDVDYEYVDYSSAKYKRPAKWIYGSYEDDWEKDKIKTLSRSVDYDPINRAIRSLYRPTHNLRAGMEVRVNSRVSLRGGYGLQQSPYKHDVASFNKIYTYAGGIGLNVGLFFGDLSYTRRYSKNETCFYNENGITAQPLANKYTDQEIRLTIGLHIRSL